jgi:hypothetical protein
MLEPRRTSPPLLRTQLGDPVNAKDLDVQQVSTTLAPFLAALAKKPAAEQVEVLKARIRNYAAIRDVVPEPIKTLYNNQIGIMQAKLGAAQQAKALEREDQQSTRTWRVLGYTVTGTGIVAGGAVVFALLEVAGYYKRKGKYYKRMARA